MADFEYYVTKELERINLILDSNSKRISDCEKLAAVAEGKSASLREEVKTIYGHLSKVAWFVLLAVLASVLKIVIVDIK